MKCYVITRLSIGYLPVETSSAAAVSVEPELDVKDEKNQ
jgi:hypothetical protein